MLTRWNPGESLQTVVFLVEPKTHISVFFIVGLLLQPPSQDPSDSTSALHSVLSSAGSCPEGEPTGMQILFKCISEECEIPENKGGKQAVCH